MQYVYCGEYGGGTGWNETGWVFRGDAELAQERGLAGVCLWKDGTFVLGGRQTGA